MNPELVGNGMRQYTIYEINVELRKINPKYRIDDWNNDRVGRVATRPEQVWIPIGNAAYVAQHIARALDNSWYTTDTGFIYRGNIYQSLSVGEDSKIHRHDLMDLISADAEYMVSSNKLYDEQQTQLKKEKAAKENTSCYIL